MRPLKQIRPPPRRRPPRRAALRDPCAPLPFATMRIIGGEFRGRQLLGPRGEATRPITDRVKQSLFDILAPLLDGAVVHDVFAGTGSMGLESLSRGASHATFFESDRSALARLNQNIITLGLAGRSTVIRGDLFRWFDVSTVKPPHNVPARVDLVFLDPPYRFLADRADELLQLSQHLVHGHLKPEATVVFRHAAADSLALPGLQAYDTRTYGGMIVELLRPDRATRSD